MILRRLECTPPPHRTVRRRTVDPGPTPNAAAPSGSWLRRAEDRWLADVPVRRTTIVRMLVSGYATAFLLGRSWYLLAASELPRRSWHPVGVFSVLDAPPMRMLIALVWAGGVWAGVCATCGLRTRLSQPALAVCFLLVGTYGNSWGQLFHTEHLVAIHLVVLALAAVDRNRAVGLRRAGAADGSGGFTDAPSGAAAHEATAPGWPLRLMTAATAITYLLAGVAKVRLGGWDWLSGEALLHHVAYDNIRKEMVGSVASPVVGTAMRWDWWWRPAGLLAVAVELSAPILVLRARWRAVWAVLAWGFHLGVVVLMAIVFSYPLSGVAFASMFKLERLPTVRAMRRRNDHSRRL